VPLSDRHPLPSIRTCHAFLFKIRKTRFPVVKISMKCKTNTLLFYENDSLYITSEEWGEVKFRQYLGVLFSKSFKRNRDMLFVLVCSVQIPHSQHNIPTNCKTLKINQVVPVNVIRSYNIHTFDVSTINHEINDRCLHIAHVSML
jgi:hypothetical protein